MIRKIIQIDEERCNGCGACAKACHEGAIGMVGGKAILRKDDYCDGLGHCLPTCPTGAITFVEREAAAYDEVAVKENQRLRTPVGDSLPCGCPGTHAREIVRGESRLEPGASAKSALRQWPVQIKLVPVNASYFEGASLLVAADCTAFAYGGFHQELMRNKVVLIGCPKLDQGDYSEKLTEIIRQNDIRSVTVARMEVPCCGGIEQAVKTALQQSGKFIPWQVVTISTDGNILD